MKKNCRLILMKDKRTRANEMSRATKKAGFSTKVTASHVKSLPRPFFSKVEFVSPSSRSLL